MVGVVLAAGYGSRMHPLTKDIPKALLPVGERPILGHLERKISSSAIGLKEVLLVSNHRFAEVFRQWAASLRSSIPWFILDDGSTCDEDRLGSMGDLAFALRYKGLEEDLLVVGSDNLLE